MRLHPIWRLGICAIAVLVVARALPPLIVGLARSIPLIDHNTPLIKQDWSELLIHVPAWTYLQVIFGAALFALSSKVARFMLQFGISENREGSAK